MKKEEIQDLRKLDLEKLVEKRAALKAEAAKVDLQLKTGVLKDTSLPKKLQKQGARLETVISEKRLDLSK